MDEIIDERTRKYMRALAEEDDEPTAHRPAKREDPDVEADTMDDDDDEGITRKLDAPLRVPSVKLAKDFYRSHPDAEIDVQFPTVYEEDRSAKLSDLGTSQQLGYISHRRAAEQSAKELGFEEYDYDEEQETISQEQPTTLGPVPSEAIPPEGEEELGFSDQPQKRGDLSAPEQAEFRKGQGYEEGGVEESLETVLAELRALRETVARLEGAKMAEAARPQAQPAQPINVEVHPPDIRVETPPVRVDSPVTIQPPTVEVHPPAENAKMVKIIERDEKGLITRIIERPEESDAK